MTKLYLAYGSNMNRAQMKRRCPAAKPLRAIVIDDARLVFRGVADIEYCHGESVPVVLWEITAACEVSLDRFEGVAAGVYEKKIIPLDNGEEALTYVMRSSGIAPPSRDYFERIKQGYADFSIDPEPLDVALKHSHVCKRHTSETRRREARAMAQNGGRIVAHALKPTTVKLNTIAEFRESQPELELGGHVSDFSEEELSEITRSFTAPPARPMEGYNYSKRAIANSQPRSTAGPDGGRRFCFKVAVRRIKKPKPQRRKNLSDWLDDRKNGGGNY